MNLLTVCLIVHLKYQQFWEKMLRAYPLIIYSIINGFNFGFFEEILPRPDLYEIK